jgi:hypothetical protein
VVQSMMLLVAVTECEEHGGSVKVTVATPGCKETRETCMSLESAKFLHGEMARLASTALDMCKRAAEKLDREEKRAREATAN